MANPLTGGSTTPNVAAVSGTNTGSGGLGVWGICATGHGVQGDSTSSKGVVGTSEKFHGVFGHSTQNVGVAGESDAMWGVLGVSKSAGGIGVHGKNEAGGDGVVGFGRRGVFGSSVEFQGVSGHNAENAGVVGESEKFHAVFGVSHDPNNGGVFGVNDKGGWGVIGRSASNTGVSGESDTGIGVHGKGGRRAGFFEGDVEVTGDILLTNADCAEDFDMADGGVAEPGTVMVLANEGCLRQSHRPYDKCVAGVISGAGSHKPGIILDKRQTQHNRQPVALLGKVYCKVDAQYASVEMGDLLTTSPTLGYAMKASEPVKAFGAVIGKALRPLQEGQGLIPILIALQ